jgi:hypothetical protein
MLGMIGCFGENCMSVSPEGSQVSVHPSSDRQVPELIASIARAGNPEGTAAMWIRDRLDGLRNDEDFAQ